jgi:hypothetical protein
MVASVRAVELAKHFDMVDTKSLFSRLARLSSSTNCACALQREAI